MLPPPAWFQDNTQATTSDTSGDTGTTGVRQQQPGEGWFMLLMPVGIIVLFIFLFYLPHRRQERERQLLLAGSKKGDRIVTTAGIYGTVTDVSPDKDEITVEVANNVRIKMMKSAIYVNLTSQEANAQASKTPGSTETKKS